MNAQNFSLEMIQRFLAQKRIAMLGVSRDPKDLSVMLFDELSRRGYEVVPVNPNTSTINGHPCAARVQDIHPPVTAALLMTSPEVTEKIVQDCYAAGVKQVWMYRAAGKGAVSNKAVDFCRERGMEVIPGECPFMFLPKPGGIHGFHRFLRKILGRYPPHCEAA